MNIKLIRFDTEITLYWDKPDLTISAYTICVNGTPAGTTNTTHYTIGQLSPDTEYTIDVYADGLAPEHLIARTTPAKRRLDVALPPYHAVGDGTTMNTAAFQQALDDCDAASQVYLPAGTYLTGALHMHSDTELYLEEGATLQGSDVVADYLPKIPSRFEGTELACYSSLLNPGHLDHNAGYNCSNVTLRGHGTISGGVEDVRIWDCDLANSLNGIEIKGTKKRGGYVRGIHVQDCSAPRILMHSVGYNDDGISAPQPPVFSDCTFERLALTGYCYNRHTDEHSYCDAIELAGFDEAGYEVHDITFRDITIGQAGISRSRKLSLQLCSQITLERLRCL